MDVQPEMQIPVVPIEYAGKWIAWDSHRTKIVASGLTLVEAKDAANTSGESQPILAKAPRADVRVIGGKR